MSTLSTKRVLLSAKLYANLNKYSFSIEKIVFLGYVVSSVGISADQEMIKSIFE